MQNNKDMREDLARQVRNLNKEKKDLERELKKAKEKLLKLLKSRKIDKEEYLDGLTATIVYSTYPYLGKSLLAQRLDVDLEFLEKCFKECSFSKEKNPYVKVS